MNVAGFAGSLFFCAAVRRSGKGASSWCATSSRNERSRPGKGRALLATRAQMACSSALRWRPRNGCLRIQSGQRAFGQKQEGRAARGHTAGNDPRFVPGTPEGIEAIGAFDRAACVLRNPEPIRLRPVGRQQDRRAERNELRIGGDRGEGAYEEVSASELRTTRGVYDVRTAPAGFDVQDGQDREEIAAVEALPRAGVFGWVAAE